ncbi:hypothetical protein BZG36_02052 [Bifiguratus adelaidae]|uniref:Sestrin n=1 Tax=Bifiguratus adelaidae TaxID=1938954 RepID=A0A261Y220_9FUNG|nr:hypothetical protein BZG36_02052 [Bifiguratus adelaidae]
MAPQSILASSGPSTPRPTASSSKDQNTEQINVLGIKRLDRDLPPSPTFSFESSASSRQQSRRGSLSPATPTATTKVFVPELVSTTTGSSATPSSFHWQQLTSTPSAASPSTTAPRMSHSREELMQIQEDSENEELHEQLRLYLLAILRFSISCPYRDVRKAFGRFLRDLKSANIPVPEPIYPSPSFFISMNDIFSLEEADDGYTIPASPSLRHYPSYSSISYPRPYDFAFSPRADQRSLYSNDEERRDFSSSPGVSTETLPRVANRTPETSPSLPKPSSTVAMSDKDANAVPSWKNANPMAIENIWDGFAPGRPCDSYVRSVLEHGFLQSGRLSNVARVMAFFPTFYEKFEVIIGSLMRKPSGPLDLSWRNYIAIMAAAEHSCQFLVSIQKSEFLHNSGDPLWLESLSHAPIKLRKLSKISSILAREPWRLSPEEHIAPLLRDTHGGGFVAGEHWTKAELIQAMCVLITYHGLSSFVLGCGIVPEVDTRGGYYVSGTSHSQDEEGLGIEHELYGENWTAGDLDAVPTQVESESTVSDVLQSSLQVSVEHIDLHPDSISASQQGETRDYVTLTGEALEANGIPRRLSRHFSIPSSTSSGSYSKSFGPTVFDSFAYGLGVSLPLPDLELRSKGPTTESDPIIDLRTTRMIQLLRRKSVLEPTEGEGSLEDVEAVQTFELKDGNADDTSSDEDGVALFGTQEATNELTESQIINLAGSSASGDASKTSDGIHQRTMRVNQVHEDLSRFLDHGSRRSSDGDTDGDKAHIKEPTGTIRVITSEDFSQSGLPSFELGEYNWEDHGISTISKYLPGIGEELDDMFQEVLNITDWSLSQTQSELPIDTWPLRQALWYYALRLLGVNQEDYDYSNLRRYLNPQTKAYIKKVIRRPETVRYADWKRIGLNLRPEEKCHVALLAIEARIQAEIMYSLRNVMQAGF